MFDSLYRACLGGAPMAKAVRTVREDGSLRAIQGQAFAWILSQMGQPAADPHGCPKLFQRDVLHQLNLQHRDWFLDAEAMLGAAEQGLEIAETPVTMRPAQPATAKFTLHDTLCQPMGEEEDKMMISLVAAGPGLQRTKQRNRNRGRWRHRGNRRTRHRNRSPR